MEEQYLHNLMDKYELGEISIDEFIGKLQIPTNFSNPEYVNLDYHRTDRTGLPEVIYSPGKTADQVVEIFKKLQETSKQVLATRVSADLYGQIKDRLPNTIYLPLGRLLYIDKQLDREMLPGIVVLTAGTSDISVAEEAAKTAELMGSQVERIYDVGVAGLHRLLNCLPQLNKANVIIVVAGMDGALPSVVAGLVTAPIIAVPTSVGYGASFQGIAALLGMLNSCAPGVAVVNIDNGFGAGCMAVKINRLQVNEVSN